MERALHRYSPELKQRLVAEIEAGHLSLREAARDAQTSVTMIQKWVEEYGRYQPKRDIVEVVMKSEQDQIAALKQALAEAHLKLVVYDELIVQANKHFKTDLKKNFGMPPSAPSVRRETTSPSAPSAASFNAPGTRTTSGDGAAPRSATRKR
jgi:transposase-like protein